MGKVFSPGQIRTPQTGTNDIFARLLSGGLTGQSQAGQALASGFKLPGYSGPFTATSNPLQTQGTQAISDALASYDPGAGQDILTQFASMFGGPRVGMDQIGSAVNNNAGKSVLDAAASGGLDLQSLIKTIGSSGLGTAQDAISTLTNNPVVSALMHLGTGGQTSANPALAAILGFQSSLPGVSALQTFNPTLGERAGLNSVAGQDVLSPALSPLNDAQSLIRSYASLPAVSSLLSGNGADIGQVFQALDAQRRQALGTDIRDLREQYSGVGLRYGSDLSQAIATRQGQSEQNLNATMAQLIPSLLSSSNQSQSIGLNFLAQLPQLLTQVGGTTGNLNLGQQQNTISSLGQAGNLGLGSSGLTLQGMQSAISSILQGQGLNLDALKTAASVTGSTNSADLATMAQALASAGGLTNSGASSAADIALRGQGQSADILNALLGQQIGAAGQSSGATLTGADILSRFGTGVNSDALQALLASPGALSTITGILPSLAGTAFNAGQTLYGNADTGVARQIQDYTQQLSLLPNIIAYMSGIQPPQLKPSPWDTAVGAVKDVQNIVSSQLFAKKALK